MWPASTADINQISYGSGGPKEPELLMDLGELNVELSGLEFIRAATLEREVLEGSRHTGRG